MKHVALLFLPALLCSPLFAAETQADIDFRALQAMMMAMSASTVPTAAIRMKGWTPKLMGGA